jgi:RNA polymerase sigma-70 factor (ECF subfamily)
MGAVDDVTRLALEARDGDRVSFSGFVRRTQGDVWRLCAHVVDPASADDLTQETYLRAVRAIRRYRGDAPAKVWLLGIARRTCIDEIRRRTRGRRAVQRLVPRPQVAPSPDGAVALDDLVAALDDDRRTAFVLTQLLGLPYEDAAAVVGCPIGTIRSRVARARADLLSGLADDDDREAGTTPNGRR